MDNTTRTITNLKNGGSVESETAVLNAPNDGAGRVPTILADSSTRTVPLPVAIETLRAKPRDEEIQRATCLASRSDFTDFYSQTVLDEAVDEVAAKRLELQRKWTDEFRKEYRDLKEEAQR